MPDVPADGPLQIDEVECSRVGDDGRNVVVRVAGKLRGRRPGPDGRALLVIAADGRRHRFPPILDTRRTRLPRPGRWSARFTIPARLEDRLKEEAWIWWGNTEIPIPASLLVVTGEAEPDEAPPAQQQDETEEESMPRPSRKLSSELANQVAARVREALEQAEAELDNPKTAEPGVASESEADAERGMYAEAGADAEPAPPPERDMPGATAREPVAAALEPAAAEASGTATEIVTALRREVQARAATEVQLRGELADAKAELEARARTQVELEATHAQLRGELDELLAMVKSETGRRSEVESKAVVLAAQVADLQEQIDQHSDQERQARERAQARERELGEELESVRSELAEAIVAREGVNGEVAGLRAEVQRLTNELDELRTRERGRESGLDEAQALLSEARALTASLRSHGGGATAEETES